MLTRELFDALDKRLFDERICTRLLLKKLNDTPEDETALRNQILKELIPNAGAGLSLQPPFYRDYGRNIGP